MRFRYIAIEGPPGLGKTSLAQRLSERLEGESVLDDELNPFFDDFLAGRSGAAFQAQVFYLMNRYLKLSRLSQRELFKGVEIADFMMAKDRIYAYLNLDDTELMLYEKIYPTIAATVPAPEIVIYLQAPASTLLKRLRRGATRVPDDEAVREIIRAYDYFFFHYSATPLLIVNCSEVDFARPETKLDDLIAEIGLMSGGTRYYVPTAG